MSMVIHHRDPTAGRYECSGPDCNGPALPGSPIPICSRHLRQTFEFAQGMVSAYWIESYAVSAARVDADVRKIVDTRPKPPVVDIPSWVYFVRIDDLIKIGFTTYPRARFKELRPDEVLALIPGTLVDEKRLHAAFHHLLAKGREYFRPEPDLLAFIAAIVHDAA